MSGKYALIIGNTEYIDPGLAQLTAPGKDAEDFARILKDKDLCDFDEVKILLNQLSSSVVESIDEFFDQKKPDDMLVLYFSGHGVRDEMGLLYLAVKNTIRSRLRSTAIRSDYIREAMDQSRSKRQILILDCCNSGAFPQGTKAEVGGTMGMTRAFQGYGRFVLTASDATQFAWEGDQVIGQTDNSLFTHFLVKGLGGDADSDGDGKITVDELYDYAYDQISRVTPKQTPTKSASKQEGEIVLRQITRIEDIKPVALPAELIDETEDTRPYVREVAVQKLERILKGKNIGLARSAREALERIATDDDSRRVSQAATQVLESIRQPEQEAQRIALQRANEERIARENAQQERLERERLAAQKTEKALLVPEKAAKSGTVISQRTLFSLIVATLVIGLTSIGGYYMFQGIGPRTTPALSATEEQHIATATVEGTLVATSAVPIQSPPDTTSIAETPSPTSTSNVETYVFIAASRAYLYKGPDLAYGLAVKKGYPRGEKFTVIARNPSGLWLLCRASDGIDGWLYIEWIDLDIDAFVIPTASFIPTVVPIPTRNRPSEGPAPTAPTECLPPDPCDPASLSPARTEVSLVSSAH
jgi:uncharacterized caspase-like protein